MSKWEVEFTGTENIQEILDKLPEKFAKKPVLAAFRKGARPLINEIKRLVPSASGDIKKSIGSSAERGGIALKVGFRGGKYMPNWFKAYWQNYGTLSNRRSSHSFKRGRKSKSASWSGGIRGRLFVEDAWNNKANEVQQVIEKELETQTVKFLQKHAVK